MRLAARKPIAAYAGSFLLLGAGFLVTSCREATTAPQQTLSSISITPANPPPIAAGATLQLSATVLDTNGQPISGQTVTFATSTPSVATVSSDGQVSSLGPAGGATITATTGSLSASVLVSVVAGPSASLTRTSPDPGSVIPPSGTAGDSVRFVVKDAFGNPRMQETVAFTVSPGDAQASPSSVQTDAQGRAATMFITGATAGPNTLNATVVGLPAVSFSVTTAQGSVSISSVLPSLLTPGAVVTINGAGFDPTATGDAVTLDHQVVPVTSASSTQLVFTIPTTLACTPAHQAVIQITANGEGAIARQAIKVGALRSLTVGSAVVLTNAADIYCTELSPASGRYAVNIVNASTVAPALTPFQFVGATSIPSGTTLAAQAFTLRQSSVSGPIVGRQFAAAGLAQADRSALHDVVLESNRQIYARMKGRFNRTRKQPAGAPGTGRASLVAAAAAVGDTRTFRVLQPSTSLNSTGGCSGNFVEITARVVYVGTRSIIYEDIAAPLAGRMDSYFTQLGQEFDTSMYPSDSSYFGDPLITDPYTDNDQHLNMVFTPSVPSGLGGFVTACDMFQRNMTDDQVSNFGENFYARVPTVAGTGFSTDNPDAWRRAMRPVIVHEVKHIASDGAHIVNNANAFEESWLEEGMAFVAEEVWVRDRIYPGAAWKGNMNYASTIYCDVRPSFPECSDRPYVMIDHFDRLYSFLDVPGATSLFGRVSDGDFTFYGVSWSFIRYNADRYAASEVGFLQGITHATDVTGLANIARQAGADPDQMLGMWSLALYLDENSSMAGNADVNFPSWDTRDIFGSMSSDFPQFFPKTYPLAPLPIGVGDFAIFNSGIRGGSFRAYDLTGLTAGTRAIGVSGGSSLRLVVARIQ